MINSIKIKIHWIWGFIIQSKICFQSFNFKNQISTLQKLRIEKERKFQNSSETKCNKRKIKKGKNQKLPNIDKVFLIRFFVDWNVSIKPDRLLPVKVY